ncbi:MAG: hypothetical protein ACFFD2_02615 [Promethearchaeota archaeon]
MELKDRVLSFLRGIGEYFTDNFLLFSEPKKAIEKINKKRIRLSLFLVSIFLISCIHFFFNFLVSEGPFRYTNAWNIVNIIGLAWQIFVFVIFVILFSPLLVDIISSKFTGIKDQFSSLSKVYFHTLIIFALYPIINLYFLIFGVPYGFYLPFSSKAMITVGQIVEGILLAIISIFIIYYFYRSSKAVIISVIFLGISFPLILYGLDFVYILSSRFYGFERYGLMDDPAHIVLWCMENIWFCLLVLGFGIIYFYRVKKNYFKLFTRNQLIFNFSLPFFVILGYVISGMPLPIPQLISLIISSIAAGNFILLLYNSYYKSFNNTEKSNFLNKWETFMCAFWLLTIAISFSLIVSFISALFIGLCFIGSSILIRYSQIVIKHKLQLIFSFLTFYLILLMGSVPTYFFVFSEGPSIVAVELPTLLSLLVSIPIALIPAIFLKFFSFYPYYRESS